jgi:hypothetical protein
MWRSILLFASSQQPLSLARPAHALNLFKLSFSSTHDGPFTDANPLELLDCLVTLSLFASLPLVLDLSNVHTWVIWRG